MRAHNAAEAVYYSLPEMPQLPKLPQLPELHNLQQNVLLQMQNVRSTAVASAHDAYAILQVIFMFLSLWKNSKEFSFFVWTKNVLVDAKYFADSCPVSFDVARPRDVVDLRQWTWTVTLKADLRLGIVTILSDTFSGKFLACGVCTHCLKMDVLEIDSHFLP